MAAIRGYRINAPNVEGAFKKVSEQGRGRLVPVKRCATDKTQGEAVPAPLNAP